jgi:polyhydroxyalkanoate synthase
MSSATMNMWGLAPHLQTVVKPEKNDKRFKTAEWDQDTVFNVIKQFYLLTATTMIKTNAELHGLDKSQHHKLMFYLRQYLDAISPTNCAITNPEIIQETVKTSGQNIVRGMQNFVRDMQEGQIRITDMEAFKVGQDLATTPGEVVYRNKLMELIQYRPTTEKVQAIPLIFCPPWINRYYILDLQQKNSMIKFLLEQGFNIFVISWKNPTPDMSDVTLEDYMDLGPLDAIEVVKQITGSKKVNMTGICIGGILLMMTTAYLNAQKDYSINTSTLIVSSQDFSEKGEMEVFLDGPELAFAEGMMRAQGYLGNSSLATSFFLLQDNDLIWNNVVSNYLLGKEPPAFDLLFWNSDGTRIPHATHSYYLRNCYVENNLIKPGGIVLKGVPIDLRNITQDVYSVGMVKDHIVPWKASWRVTELTGGKVRFVLGGSGHIAGILSAPNKGRGYWLNEQSTTNADEWLKNATRYDGTWWTDWITWLKARSGEEIAAPTSLGSAKFPPIMPAPGTYVLEK